MNQTEYDSKSAIEHMRIAVHNFNCCREDFVSKFTWQELMAIYEAWMLSGCDIYPDHWENRQVEEAIRGIVPSFDWNEQPHYPPYLLKVWCRQGSTREGINK